jgi:flavin reductase (DIM6/NTAB) family NADH-FMN oxidoreductase RutF
MKIHTIEPKILYFGTPVALISSLNEDGSTNLAPISFFLGAGLDLRAGALG